MGAVKKIFGGGSSSPKIEKVAPAPVAITNVSTGGDVGDSVNKARKRRGYSSTVTMDTLVGAATDAARKLLG